MAAEDLQAGPQLLGYFLNWALLGVLNTQVYLYYLSFPRDRWSLKAFVYGVLIFEWIQTGLTTAAAFDQHVYNYGDVSRLFSLPYVWFCVPIMSAMISAVVQIFFAWRIYRLGKSIILPCIIVFIALFQLGAGTAGGVQMHALPSAEDLAPAHAALAAWLVGTAVTDAVIAVAMTVLLLRARTGIAGTDAIISSIIRLTVETGSMTATFAIAETVLVLKPSLGMTLLYECPALVLTKLYANTLLVNLNNRAFVKKEDSVNVFESIHITRLNTTLNSAIERDDAHTSVVLRDKDSHRSVSKLDSNLAELGDAKTVQQDDMPFSSVPLRSS